LMVASLHPTRIAYASCIYKVPARKNQLCHLSSLPA